MHGIHKCTCKEATPIINIRRNTKHLFVKYSINAYSIVSKNCLRQTVVRTKPSMICKMQQHIEHRYRFHLNSILFAFEKYTNEIFYEEFHSRGNPHVFFFAFFWLIELDFVPSFNGFFAIFIILLVESLLLSMAFEFRFL